MPTYDYACRNCGHEFELFQQMTAKVKRKCPECGKASLERLIGTGAGVIFKGGGFYETDYRSDSYRKGAEAEKKASEKKSADSTSGGDSAQGKGEASAGSAPSKKKGAKKKASESGGDA